MNEKVSKLKTFIFALFKELLCKQKKVKDQELRNNARYKFDLI